MGRILKGLAAAVVVTALVLGVVYVAVQTKRVDPGQADQLIVHADGWISQQAPAQHASLWSNKVFHYALGGVALSTFLVTLLGLYKPVWRIGVGGFVLGGYALLGSLSLLGGTVLGALGVLFPPLMVAWDKLSKGSKGWKSGLVSNAGFLISLFGLIGAAVVSVLHFIPARDLSGLNALPHWPFIAWASAAAGSGLLYWIAAAGVVGVIKGLLTVCVAIPYGLVWAVVCALFPPAVAIPNRNDSTKHGKLWNALQGTALAFGAIAIFATVAAVLILGANYYSGHAGAKAFVGNLPLGISTLYAWAGLSAIALLYMLGSPRKKQEAPASGDAASPPAAPEPVAAPVAMTAARRFDSEWSVMNDLTTSGSDYSEEELRSLLAECQRNGWNEAAQLVGNRLSTT